jgi:predicted nucleotidyltransferase
MKTRQTSGSDELMHPIPINSRLSLRFTMTPEQLTEFCQRRQINELALFGSVLRDDFHSDSDIDILVTFQPDTRISLLDLVDMQLELEDRLQRKVDLLTKKSVENSPNWIRRKEILETAQVIYEVKPD